jgi:tetratricopeptide (TPR) repeat protein
VNTLPPRLAPLRIALLACLLAGTTGAAMAQVGRYDQAERDARKHHAQDADAASKFPAAKRESPHQQATKKGGEALNEIVEAYQAKNYADAIAKAEAFAASTDNAYEKSFAYQIAGTAAADSKDSARAAADFQKAIDANGLDNDQHYQVMYNLAVVQYQQGKNDEALKTLDRYLAETGVDPTATAALRASMLANSNKPAQAAETFEQAWRKDPKDGKALLNAATLYQQAKQFDKANALLAEAKTKGGLDADGYRALYVGYVNANQPKDAIATIDEGLAKGVVQPSADLAKVYSVLAQNAYAAGDTATAIAMYTRAAAVPGDGEAALNLARVYYNSGKMAQARQAAQQALEKGVKNQAEAKRLASQKGP